jgi:chemotaxis protein methyltransferase CheR
MVRSREIAELLEAIFRSYGHDFRAYARPSVTRRIQKRLKEEQLKTIEALQDLVVRDGDAMARLLGDLSVGFTSMFRDPTAFRVLRETVVPFLREQPVLRIWDAGCASGEEAYSLAILLDEAGLLDRTRIYATDMSAGAVADARSGFVPMSTMEINTTNYELAGGRRKLDDYYEVSSGAARFDPRLLENVAFAQHNLATDGPFSEFHLVVCRNVLMYFAAPLQDRVLTMLTRSLLPPGVLVLGRAEGVRFTAVDAEYDEVRAGERLYARRFSARS